VLLVWIPCPKANPHVGTSNAERKLLQLGILQEESLVNLGVESPTAIDDSPGPRYALGKATNSAGYCRCSGRLGCALLCLKLV
jgi:hypothetical protein